MACMGVSETANPSAHSAWAAREARSSSSQGRSCQVCFEASAVKLLYHAGHVAHHAHGHAPVAADLGRGRVNLDNLGIGGHVGRAAKADGVVLLAAQ